MGTETFPLERCGVILRQAEITSEELTESPVTQSRLARWT